MSGIVYHTCEKCKDLALYYIEIAGERQYYLHYCKSLKKLVDFHIEDEKKKS
jgi:hypothetical protein